jgi:hypothetical protein
MTGNICVYCPGGPDSDFEYSTQSYTGYEPTSMRAIRARLFIVNSLFLLESNHFKIYFAGTTRIFKQDKELNRQALNFVDFFFNQSLRLVTFSINLCYS